MTAVAVEYRPAMDSCMVGMRLCRTCALTAPDSSDPGEYPEEYGRLAQGYFNRNTWTESIASAKVSMNKLLYNLGGWGYLTLPSTLKMKRPASSRAV